MDFIQSKMRTGKKYDIELKYAEKTTSGTRVIDPNGQALNLPKIEPGYVAIISIVEN